MRLRRSHRGPRMLVSRSYLRLARYDQTSMRVVQLRNRVSCRLNANACRQLASGPSHFVIGNARFGLSSRVVTGGRGQRPTTVPKEHPKISHGAAVCNCPRGGEARQNEAVVQCLFGADQVHADQFSRNGRTRLAASKHAPQCLDRCSRCAPTHPK